MSLASVTLPAPTLTARRKPTMKMLSLPRLRLLFSCLVLCVAAGAPQLSQANEAEFLRWRQQSEQAEARGDIPQSIRAALRMHDLKPGDLPTMLVLSGLYGKAGQPEQQLLWSRRILKLQPRHLEALINQGNAQAVLGDVQGARSSYLIAQTVDPASRLPAYSLGVLSQALDRDEEAIGYFQSVLKRFPDFEDARFNLAVSQANTGRVREAIRNLDQILKANPAARDARELRDTLRRP
jgi:tetratricopeptide (TPR) repeat protein